MLFYLSKGHNQLYSTEDPLPYQTHKGTLHRLLVETKTLIKFCNRGYSELAELDTKIITNKRNELLGDYIEYVLPTSIINNVLTPRPLLETPRLLRLQESVFKYGIVTPALLQLVYPTSSKFNSNYPEVQFIVKEGRHRMLAAALINYNEPTPAFILVSQGDDNGHKRLRNCSNNTYRT